MVKTLVYCPLDSLTSMMGVSTILDLVAYDYMNMSCRQVAFEYHLIKFSFLFLQIFSTYFTNREIGKN